MDSKFTFTKLCVATFILSDPSVRFVATNTDSTFPSSVRTFPGTGSLVSALSTASGRDPVVLGKPHKYLLDLLSLCGVSCSVRTLMVGDRVDTDMRFGRSGGMRTLLVLTGVVSDVSEVSEPESVDWYADSAADLL
jgi:4-nitrophenyl phosphatase